MYSIKRRGVYWTFRDSSAAFIRGRRLFKIQFISSYGNWTFEFQKTETWFISCPKSHFLYRSLFQNVHINTTAMCPLHIFVFKEITFLGLRKVDYITAFAFWVYYSNKTRRLFEGGVYKYFCSKMRRLFESRD